MPEETSFVGIDKSRPAIFTGRKMVDCRAQRPLYPGFSICELGVFRASARLVLDEKCMPSLTLFYLTLLNVFGLLLMVLWPRRAGCPGIYSICFQMPHTCPRPAFIDCDKIVFRSQKPDRYSCPKFHPF